MSYQVKIISDRKGMQDFLDLPFRMHHNDPDWVPPLKSEIIRTLDQTKNPYFAGVDLKKFVCYKGNEPVARAISVINPEHWKKFHEKTAFFGFYESVEDEQASAILLKTIEEYCQLKSAERLEGPFNPNHYSELGMLVKNYERSAFFETHNPEYYPSFIKKSGFEVVYRIHTRINTETRDFLSQRHKNYKIPPESNGFTVRHFDLFDMKAELERIREVFNDAFSENWHFLPVSRKEYLFSAKSLFAVTNPSLIQIVEHHGKPVGVLQCVLNINPLLQSLKGRIRITDIYKLLVQRKAIREVVVYAVGIKKAYQNSRVFILLIDAMLKIAQRYPVVYSTWMSDDNIAAVRASEIIGLKPYKWFEVYGKTLKSRTT
ncbi:MAG: hypothetical protein NT175_03530 [Bacteroidetes bacterium]|nr:hypothetical protein [Bacteroidota bacterium]